MPEHSSHLLQRHDVGCFSALKQAYGRSVEQLMSRGVNYINKNEFLPPIGRLGSKPCIRATYRQDLQQLA
jgi:hypothetical protein